MSLHFKDGVTLDGIQPITISGIHTAATVYESWGLDLVVTSVTDGKHSEGSLHYEGLAFDCRIWAIPEHIMPSFMRHLKETLGPSWDVVWHPVTHKTHIHIEYDPK